MSKTRPNPPGAASAGSTLSGEAGIAAARRLGVTLTHPERMEYPAEGISKAEIAAYYAAVAGRMLPHLARRPLSLVRSPQGGIAHTFFQKHNSGGFPAQFRTMPIAEKDGKTDSYMYVEDLAGLVAGVQMNTLEFHIWGSRVDDIERPDRIVFDIDPDEGLDFAQVRQAALGIRDRLASIGLTTYAMVTGGKGIHVIAPLKPTLEWPEVKAFCRGFAQALEAAEPDRFTANIRKANRKGRVFVDYLRNERGSTAIAPFSTRARAGAPCAVPVSWDEVETLDRANGFSLAEAAARANAPDPWPDYFAVKQAITGAMVKAVGNETKT
jgi:bifunctional non-homologous end joining protein LigD